MITQKNISIAREIDILRSIGIQDYEISYLMHQRIKFERAKKWEDYRN